MKTPVMTTKAKTKPKNRFANNGICIWVVFARFYN